MNITDFNDLTLAEHTGGLSPCVLVADSIDGRKRAIQIERMEILAIIGIIVLGLIIFTSVGILGHLFDVFIV